MPKRERKESALANDMRVVTVPHDCAGGNVGLYAGAAGTVDLTTSQGTVLTGIPLGDFGVLPMQCQSVQATTVVPLYELIQN